MLAGMKFSITGTQNSHGPIHSHPSGHNILSKGQTITDLGGGGLGSGREFVMSFFFLAKRLMSVFFLANRLINFFPSETCL